MGFRPEQSLKQKQLHRQRFATMQLQTILAKADLVDDLTQDAELDSEPPELSDLEDYGDSEVFLHGTEVETSFDREWLSHLPLVAQLPRRARPIVRFRLDDHLQLQAVGRQCSNDLRSVVAEAVAEHVRRSGVALLQPDDWCQLPAINGDKGLLDLVQDDREQRRLTSALAKVGSDLKNFAILLPTGDVITPQTLMNQAREGKHATRAAVLRLQAKRPNTIAGERWTSDDWRIFDDTQRKKKTRRAKGAGASQS